MTIFRLYLNKDQETAWLNEMAQKGYALKSFFAGFYRFETCSPGEYVYQIDLGSKLFAVDNDYREFMKENNIDIVCVWGYWVILRKRAAEGNFVLYTDVDSSIEHYTKILKLFKIVTILEVICFCFEAYVAMHNVSAGLLGMCIIGLLTICMIHAALSTRRIIDKLKERKGELPANGIRSGSISPVLISGLFLNLGAVALNRSGNVSHSIVAFIQLIAIVLMCAGIFSQIKILKKRS